MSYVIRRTVNKSVLFAKAACERRSGVWLPKGKIDWVTSVEAATHFRIRHAAEGVMGALPFIQGEDIRMIEV